MAFVFIFVLLTSMAVNVMCEGDEACRQLEFRSHLFYPGKRLKNHLIRTEHSVSKDFCGPLCFMEPNCVSFNMEVISGNPSVINCELNNSTHFEHPDHLESEANFHYRGSENSCTKEICGVNGICQAGFTEKGYRCVCIDGFMGEDCMTDIDECTDATHKCPANADCANTHGAYNCTCKSGYTGDGFNCTDIDECDAPVDPCDVVANSTCNNTDGSYICQCNDGYVKNDSNCEDIDECAGPVDPCSAVVNTVCNNTKGSYICQCKDGFTMNGSICEDINECAATVDPCSTVAHSTCQNNNGSFICQCNDGYVKSSNGVGCEVDVCLPPKYQNLSDAERKETFGLVNSQCDNTLNGWYRFEGAAGTKMATTCPPIRSCDASFPGWLDGSHPTVAEGEVTRRVCFNQGSCCDQSTNTQVKNCSSYYIYKLSPLTPQVGVNCNARYCGAD